MSDVRTLDLSQRLVNRRQDIAKLRADGLDVAKRELDGVQVRAQAFVAPTDRIERARDLQRLRFPISGQIAGRERARTGEGGAGTGRRGLFPRLIAKGEGAQVVRGRRTVLEQLFPNGAHWRRPLNPAILKWSHRIQPTTPLYR